ncbi:S-adenosylmethionine synthetase [Lachnospiraceae bacterium PF1-21]
MYKKVFTSESVTEGHPDKLCDQISDAVLDEFVSQDSESRVACEVAITTGLVLIMGEITSKASVDVQKIVRATIKEAGYNNGEYGFDADNCGIIISLDEQSPDIALGLSDSYAIGAGDQGMVFGYATNETVELMPAPIMYAHKISKSLSRYRKEGVLPYLRPDGKAQVTVEYDTEGTPKRIDTIVISAQHSPTVDSALIRQDLLELVRNDVINDEMIDNNTRFFVNPTGRFVVGGPKGDSGLTGRKIIVDTYGGMAKHGGGAFSGKDCTKVDRSASYMARYVAKNIVASGVARKCELQLAYAIGVKEPISIEIDTFGTGLLSDDKLIRIVNEQFDLTPKGIISALELRNPIYKQTSTYGHFGRTDINLPWERTDKEYAFH